MQLSGCGARVALSIFAVPLQVPGADFTKLDDLTRDGIDPIAFRFWTY
jgi:hypothetical protein